MNVVFDHCALWCCLFSISCAHDPINPVAESIMSHFARKWSRQISLSLQLGQTTGHKLFRHCLALSYDIIQCYVDFSHRIYTVDDEVPPMSHLVEA